MSYQYQGSPVSILRRTATRAQIQFQNNRRKWISRQNLVEIRDVDTLQNLLLSVSRQWKRSVRPRYFTSGRLRVVNHPSDVRDFALRSRDLGKAQVIAEPLVHYLWKLLDPTDRIHCLYSLPRFAVWQKGGTWISEFTHLYFYPPGAEQSALKHVQCWIDKMINGK